VVKYCPVCSKSSEQVPFLGQFCIFDAIDQKLKHFNKKIILKRCPSCKKFKILVNGNEFWVEPNQKLFLDYILEKLSIAFGEDFFLFLKKYSSNILLEDFTLEFQIEKKVYKIKLLVQFLDSLCPVCKEKSSQSYEAIVQLRGEGQKILDYESYLEKNFKKFQIRIVKKQSLKEGLNLFCKPKSRIVEFFSEKGIKFIRTTKLVGQRKNGQRIYLDTFLLRL
jgi:NMD protein affecting ribosome stability and mRNA decay